MVVVVGFWFRSNAWTGNEWKIVGRHFFIETLNFLQLIIRLHLLVIKQIFNHDVLNTKQTRKKMHFVHQINGKTVELETIQRQWVTTLCSMGFDLCVEFEEIAQVDWLLQFYCMPTKVKESETEKKCTVIGFSSLCLSLFVLPRFYGWYLLSKYCTDHFGWAIN